MVEKLNQTLRGMIDKEMTSTTMVVVRKIRARRIDGECYLATCLRNR